MLGPGKYDDAATIARLWTRSEGVILLVFRGHAGDGFSAQLPPDLLLDIPAVLRRVADELEASGPPAS